MNVISTQAFIMYSDTERNEPGKSASLLKHNLTYHFAATQVVCTKPHVPSQGTRQNLTPTRITQA